MDIFVYSDESGVFDKVHNNFFVFGGLIFLGKGEKDIQARKYKNAEKAIYLSGIDSSEELKAAKISNKQKAKLFRSLNNCIKFAVIIKEDKVLSEIFKSPKDKQRYLDYAYKIAVKRALQQLLEKGTIKEELIDNIYFFVDEHTTATNGRYELKEALEQELKRGTYNFNYSCFYRPILPHLHTVDVKFCNSATTILVRAADIVANRVYYLANADLDANLPKMNQDFLLTVLP